jgi:hypothetical protein
MKPTKVSAYCVMEDMSEAITAKNQKTIKDNGLYYLAFEACLQSYNVRNRNRRMYIGSDMWESLQSPHLKELISRNSWCGEAGHPLTEDIKRILTIDPKLISHRVTSISMIGNRLFGNVETLSAGYGRDMTICILQKLESAFSLRALAQITNQNDGSQLIKGRSHVVCFDWVILPSHIEAYQTNGKDYNVMNISVSESGNSMTDNNRLVAVNESQITNFIKDESFSVNIISNVFEVATESMIVSKDLKHAILKNGNDKYYIKIEDKIRYDISKYLKNI